MNQEVGHVYPTFKLARELTKRGHRVVYFGFEPLREIILAHGFEFTTLTCMRSRTELRALVRKFRFSEANALVATFLAEIESVLIREKISTLLVDPAVQVCAASAQGLGIKTALLFPNVVHLSQSWRIPPETCGMMPADSISTQARVILEWTRYWLSRQNPAIILSRVCGPLRILRRRITESGVYARSSAAEPRMCFPRFALLPAELDFERTDATYLGLCVDDARCEGSCNFGAFARGRKLVVCALGSQAAAYKWSGLFLQNVIHAFRNQSCWHLVVSVYGCADADEFLTAKHPEHITVTDHLPLAALNDARVMINHGGLGSIKECLNAGLPMVCAPGAYDQPGNAARVAFNGFGVSIDMRRARPFQILASVEQVDADSKIRMRILEAFQRSEDQSTFLHGVDKLESLA